MKITTSLEISSYSFLRRAGYHPLRADSKTGQLVFAKRLSSSVFPRFHAYVKENKERNLIIINLHLDQKRPVYKGSHAHLAEYEGKLVEKEAERLKGLINKGL